MELTLTPKIASKFAKIALGHVGQEYPNQPMHAMANDEDAKTRACSTRHFSGAMTGTPASTPGGFC